MKRITLLICVIMFILVGCAPVESTLFKPFAGTEPDCIANTDFATAPGSSIPEETTLPTEQATEATEVTEEQTEPVTEPVTVPTEPAFDPYAYMESMSTEELVGQLFLARCPDKSIAAAEAEKYQLGGYVLFGRDFDGESVQSLSQTINEYQSVSKVPMLIAVDEEGGTVCRVSSYSQFRDSKFPSPRSLYEEGGMDLLLQTEQEKYNLLLSLGINVNLAPVCDITTNPDSFMYSRSLGQTPEITGKYIETVVLNMDAYQLGGVLKHFPGYGDNVDTHVGVAVDSRPLELLEMHDLVPFQAGIDAECDAIMVSHTIVECLDSELPASLSPKVVTYLREEMGFGGVITTDDLIMDAISEQYGTGQAAVLAVKAGVDMLCSSSYSIQYDAVLEAVNSGDISIEHIKESVARILLWKYDLGLIS